MLNSPHSPNTRVSSRHEAVAFGSRPRDLLLVNPNTGTCPMFRTQRDAEITIGIYRRVPVLWRDEPEENPWGLSFMAMFHMANDSGAFRTREKLQRDGWTLSGNVFFRDGKRMLPLYEAKLIHHFDHRLACYSKQPQGSQDTELPRLTPERKERSEAVPLCPATGFRISIPSMR